MLTICNHFQNSGNVSQICSCVFLQTWENPNDDVLHSNWKQHLYFFVTIQSKWVMLLALNLKLRTCVICPSQSSWASLVVLIPKLDGEICFCVDYRKLNSITVQDHYPMPRMDELLDKLGSATYITRDLTNDFQQIELTEDANHKCGIV